MPDVWYINETSDDCREDCHSGPRRYLTLEQLKASTGVEIYEVDAENIDNNADYQQFKKHRGYNYEDMLEMSAESGEQIKTEYYKEHLHEDEEVRLFLEGGGYFDVRDSKDNWIRIRVSKGELLILPAYTYHRFTLGKEENAKIRRLFSGFPVWTAKFRSEADSDSRHKN